MIGETDLIFREEQKFALWLRLLVVLVLALVFLHGISSLRTTDSEQSSFHLIANVLRIYLPIVIAALFWLLRLETEVRLDGLYVRYFPFHIRFRKFSPDDLSEFYSRQYKPIREYRGWGIRYSLTGKGKAYNVSGNEGVQLVFKNGKRLLIGSQRAQELEQAIRSIIKS